MVHCRQETNLSFLSWESWLETNVSKPLGKASHDVCSAFGLAEMACMLATYYFGTRPRHQLGFRTWIAFSLDPTLSPFIYYPIFILAVKLQLQNPRLAKLLLSPTEFLRNEKSVSLLWTNDEWMDMKLLQIKTCY